LFAGGTEKNFEDVPELANQVAGLKLYLNDTFTTLKMEDTTKWSKVGKLNLDFIDTRYKCVENLFYSISSTGQQMFLSVFMQKEVNVLLPF
jgi:hypothetical protein